MVVTLEGDEITTEGDTEHTQEARNQPADLQNEDLEGVFVLSFRLLNGRAQRWQLKKK